MTTSTDKEILVPPCFFGTKKSFVRGGDVGGASRYVDLNDSRLIEDYVGHPRSCRLSEPVGSYFVTVCKSYILGC